MSGVGCAGFYFATLEEYYVGGCWLGPGNAVTDCAMILLGIYILMSFIGNDFWLDEFQDGWRVNDVGLQITFVLLFLLLPKNLINIYNNVEKPMFESKDG